MQKPNIIFIVLDTLRADRVLQKQDNIELTPFIKNILKNSIYFENCIANSPWTFPSHLSMFTGLYPIQNRILGNNIYVLNNKLPILTEILKKMGYITACYTENPWINRRTGLLRGFDKIFLKFLDKSANKINLINPFRKILSKIDRFIKCNIEINLFLKLWEILRFRISKITDKLFWKNNLSSTSENSNRSIEDINIFCSTLKNNETTQPLFLFCNIMTNHDPYVPLKDAFKLFNIKIRDFRIIKNLLLKTRISKLSVNLKSKKLSNKKVKTIEKLYGACTYSSDKLVELIFSNLEELGILENSYIIITSDHGEHLGNNLDHYFWGHGTYISLHHAVLRVPLIIYHPIIKRRIVKEQVQLKDLFFTILHMTGVQKSNNKYLEIEKSILYQIDNNCTPKFIFGEYSKSRTESKYIIRKYPRLIDSKKFLKILSYVYFLRTDRYKYISFKNANIEELFDLLRDTFEQKNIIKKLPSLGSKMRISMDKILKKIKNFNGINELTTEREKKKIINIIKSIKLNGI